ncbi:polysaccharide lyase 8 family protein [uncultured Polaribacter sp.]|uniref:polysaccharide lyase 8 family protein n=1 Tax=uncultured Polaribacter sp. TaxID=174711 RepID=UPI0026093447|nr:polysaccharide lyase 8 family protein [uncultured Polaribacter sp.]
MKLQRNFLFLMLLITIGCNKFNDKKEVTVSYPQNLHEFHKNVWTYYTNKNVEDAKIEDLLADLAQNGAFTTIDYTNKIRSNWPVKEHLQNVQDLAINYNNTSSKYYQNKKLSEQIHTSLNYWLDNDFLSTNWHDQQIGVPELLLPTLFLMENELTKKQLNKAEVLLQRAKIKMSGQNKVWLSTNVLLRSLLFRKSDSVALASTAIQSELKIAKRVGVKSDWSYHEHGAQLQFGNYGLSYLEDMIKTYTFLGNTPFQFQKDKIKFLRNIILEGQQWILYNNSYDTNACGRQLFPNEQINKANRLKACIQKMKVLDEEFTEAFNDALNSKKLSVNKHFWKSDFQVHRRKDFYFSVKMSSKRVVGTESVNKENVQGYYMGDGVALLSTNGKEYENVFPFWDWKKLPGTTIIQDKKPLPIIKFKEFKTNSTFVGGVSNGKNGIAVMDYNRDGLKAKKSWFLIDDTIVCLGSGISANTNYPVTTAVNQSFLKGNVVVGKNDAIQTNLRKGNAIQPNWILHDNIGYLFPKEGNINFSTNILEGSWNKVAKRYRPVLLTEHIFKLWINHGTQPRDKSYNYLLVPNATQDKMLRLQKNNPFKIINTKQQQSVESLDKKQAGIVFYKAGTSKIKCGITVDKPCVVLIEEKPNQLMLAVSDPSQQLKNINVTIQGKYIVENSNYNKGKTQFTVNLPQGEYAGKTVELTLEKI